MQLDLDKPAVRRAALAARDAIPASLRAAGAEAAALRAAALIGELRRNRPDAIIAGYWPMRSELDPRPLLNLLATQAIPLALPVVVANHSPLEFRRYTPGDALVVARFGQSEPAPTAPPIAPDILLVPLAAIDAKGYRIGYGGGFYDRSLGELRARRSVTAIAYGFDEQQFDAVPHDAHDAQLDWLVTPTQTLDFGRHA